MHTYIYTHKQTHTHTLSYVYVYVYVYIFTYISALTFIFQPGLGKEVAKDLVRRGADVIIAGIDKIKAFETRGEVRASNN